MTKRLRVVLDTNILLVSISSKSKYHWLFSKLINGAYELYITNEILLEYKEIIASKYNLNVAKNVIRTLLYLENVRLVTPYYKWNLITADQDDNKFVDCYIFSNSQYLVTHDKHFAHLKDIKFPKVRVCNITQFKKLLDDSLL